MIHIPYERIVTAIVEKTGLPKVEVEEKIQAKMTEFSGLLSIEGSAHIIANELGVSISEAKAEPLKISELKIGMQQIKSLVKVVAKYDVATFERNGGEGRVQSLLIGDSTGKCRLTFWHDDIALVQEVQPDDVIALTNLVVRENNGRLELHGTKKTEITRNPDGITIEVSDAPISSVPIDAPYSKINQITNETNTYVTLFGVIVQATPPYFYPVDKQTQKRVRIDEPTQFNPATHEYNYVCNVVIDDGTDTLRISAFRDEALDILGISKDELLAVREKPERFTEIANKKLGTHCKLIGKPNYNQQYERIEMVAQKVFTNIDPKEEMKRFEN